MLQLPGQLPRLIPVIQYQAPAPVLLNRDASCLRRIGSIIILPVNW